jgi:arylsulfatase A-like enzyme
MLADDRPQCAMLQYAWLVLTVCGACFASPPGAQAAEPPRPNIIILFADDMGYGDLSCYGHPQIDTPNLDRLATQGVRFEAFYTGTWCVPSRTQLLTGRHMSRMNFKGGTGSNGSGRLPPDETTLAEGLKAAGYQTHMLGKWHLGHVKDAYLPPNRGFDTWFGIPYSNDYKKPFVQTDVPLGLYEGTKMVEHPIDQDTLTTRYTQRAVQRIEKAGDDDKPFFLYLAYAMPHLPLHTADRFRGKSGHGLYADVIETIDWSAGRIMQALDAHDMADNTIVFFASDNGPWLNLGQRMLQAGNKRWHQGTTGVLRGSKHTTFEGGPRVPAIIRWPGEIRAGVDAEAPTASQDIFVTLMQVGGATLPDKPLDGYNLMPWLAGESAQSPRDHYFYIFHNKVAAYRKGPWKLRLNGKRPQLFNLESDPASRFNRIDDKPKLVEDMRDDMKAFAKEANARMPK